MKKTTKTLLTILCAAALIAASVFGTLAYLTATSQTVTNTFTAGKLIDPTKPEENKLKLLEHPVTKGDDGKYTLNEGGTPGTANSYTVVPGNNLPKDPYITVTVDDTAKAFLFITVNDTLPDTLTWAIDDTHWVALTDAQGQAVKKGNYPVYVYTAGTTNAARFTGALTADMTNIIKDKEITVPTDFITDTMTAAATLEFNAYLCQADGFDSAFAAWDACFANP